MIDRLTDTIEWFSNNDGALETEMDGAQVALNAKFSDEYKQFLKKKNGGDGRTRKGENICFFSTHELPEINSAAATNEFVPGWFIFASDLGGRSYLMRRTNDSSVIAGCFDEVLSIEEMHEEAKNLREFFEKLGAPGL